MIFMRENRGYHGSTKKGGCINNTPSLRPQPSSFFIVKILKNLLLQIYYEYHLQYTNFYIKNSFNFIHVFYINKMNSNIFNKPRPNSIWILVKRGRLNTKPPSAPQLTFWLQIYYKYIIFISSKQHLKEIKQLPYTQFNLII